MRWSLTSQWRTQRSLACLAARPITCTLRTTRSSNSPNQQFLRTTHGCRFSASGIFWIHFLGSKNAIILDWLPKSPGMLSKSATTPRPWGRFEDGAVVLHEFRTLLHPERCLNTQEMVEDTKRTNISVVRQYQVDQRVHPERGGSARPVVLKLHKMQEPAARLWWKTQNQFVPQVPGCQVNAAEVGNPATKMDI